MSKVEFYVALVVVTAMVVGGLMFVGMVDQFGQGLVSIINGGI